MSEFQVGDRVVIAGNQRETHSEYTDCGDLYSVGDVGVLVRIDPYGMYELPYLVKFEVANGRDTLYQNELWWVGVHEIEHEYISPERQAERARWAKMTPVEHKIDKLWKRSNYVRGKEDATV